MTLGDIERFCLTRAPEGCGAAATEDHDAVIVTLFYHAHAQTTARIVDFAISRLQLVSAIDPHALLEVLTREAVRKFDA